MSNTSGTLTSFTAGDIVVSISGDGGGTGTYGDNQASPITLEEITPTGSIVGYMILPQVTTVVNGVTEYAISGEYGSSSEGSLELSEDGQSLVIAGYGVTATAFNTGGAAVYGTTALAQSTSILGGSYTAVARVVADISYNGTVDTSTALYGVYNLNNPRSVATVNGTTFYLSGQGAGSGDPTQGVFVAKDGASSATSINDSSDMRTVEIVNGELYVSIDSKQVGGGELTNYGTLLPVSTTQAEVLPGIGNSITLTAAQENGINDADVGSKVNLSPENYFFATPDILYVADGGNPKEGGLGDGGLQKWTFNGTSWTLDYTLTAGLNLVPDTDSDGTSGLIGLTGTVIGGNVYLYTTNETIADLDQTYLFEITDTLAATSLPGNESFTTLVTAAADSNIRGVSFAPAEATAAAPTVSSVSTGSGLQVTNGSTLTVLSGGTVTSTTVLSGGSETIVAGGLDTGGYIAQGGTQTVLGSATGGSVGGLQYLPAAGGSVSNEIVLNGGTVDLAIKGTAGSNLTVEEGGLIEINGSITLATAVISGGVIDLQSPKATIAGTLTFENGGTLLVTSNTSAGAGDLAVISGFTTGDVIDIASNTTIGSAGTNAALSFATSGGNTVATVSGGGASDSFVFAGGATSAFLTLTSDGNGGEEITYAAPAPSVTTISNGSSGTGDLVTSGSVLNILSGGTAIAADVLAGGTVTVQVGGVDQGSTIGPGGLELLSGTASGDLVYGVQLLNSAATAVASNETIYSGGSVDLFLAGVVGSALTVESGGELNISGRGTAVATVLNGGTLSLQSPKATLSGTLTFLNGGTLDETATVSAVSSGVSFGDQAVINGFGAGDVIDLTSATAAGSAGSAATFAVTTSGGETFATVTGGGSSETFIFAGTTIATSLSLTSDGNGGEEIVYGSATSSSTSSGGSGMSGTTVSGTIGAGTVENISAGITLLAATILAGGSAVIATGGFDQGTTIESGGSETVLGSATLDLIYGVQLVSNGSALVSSETIENGGTAELFLAGVTATALTALAGGTIAINGHAAAFNTVLSGGAILLESPKATLSGTLTFDGSGTLQVTSNTSAGYGDLAVISGFGAGDVIDFTAATSVGSAGAAATSSYVTSGSDTVLTVSGGGSTESFLFAGTSIGAFLTLGPDGGGGEEITYLACYARGTRIRLAGGDVPVEDLRIGDPVVTLGGTVRPVRWIGRRRIDCARHPAPHRVWPVAIRAGAFGPAVPARDLLVSPQHAIYAEGVLVPAKILVNGLNVVQEDMAEVDYFHIELDRHDVIFAEGLPAETYLDVGDRAMFENGGGVVTLYPDMTDRDWASLVWESHGYAEIKVVGPEVEAIRATLLSRARKPGARKPGSRTRRRRKAG